jgi:hypothetical protein
MKRRQKQPGLFGWVARILIAAVPALFVAGVVHGQQLGDGGEFGFVKFGGGATDAITATATASNAAGLTATGAATNGIGVVGQGSGSGSGVSGTGGSTVGAAGVSGTGGSGAGPGGSFTGTGSGAGLNSFGGGTNGSTGLVGQSIASNGNGGAFTGSGTGYGSTSTGGATGIGAIMVAAANYGATIQGDTTSPVTAALRIVPQDTQPTTCTAVGDIYVTTAGVLRICTASGTPGTWANVGAQ